MKTNFQPFAIYPSEYEYNPVPEYADSDKFQGNAKQIITKYDKKQHKQFRKNRMQGKRSWV